MATRSRRQAARMVTVFAAMLTRPKYYWRLLWVRIRPVPPTVIHVYWGILLMHLPVTVTKAGVSSNKIMVGESSYGRSFNMAEVGCTGQDCFFTGTRFRSDATPGRCTTTGGYISNAEINELIADMGKSLDTWYDDDTASDYLVYDGEIFHFDLLPAIRLDTC